MAEFGWHFRSEKAVVTPSVRSQKFVCPSVLPIRVTRNFVPMRSLNSKQLKLIPILVCSSCLKTEQFPQRKLMRIFLPWSPLLSSITLAYMIYFGVVAQFRWTLSHQIFIYPSPFLKRRNKLIILTRSFKPETKDQYNSARWPRFAFIRFASRRGRSSNNPAAAAINFKVYFGRADDFSQL